MSIVTFDNAVLCFHHNRVKAELNQNIFTTALILIYIKEPVRIKETFENVKKLVDDEMLTEFFHYSAAYQPSLFNAIKMRKENDTYYATVLLHKIYFYYLCKLTKRLISNFKSWLILMGSNKSFEA